jgi:hypothetical protein
MLKSFQLLDEQFSSLLQVRGLDMEDVRAGKHMVPVQEVLAQSLL